MTKFSFSIALLCLVGAASAQSLESECHTIGVFGGESALFFGSSDQRYGGGFSYSYARPEPKFHFLGMKSQFMLTGYVDHTYAIKDRPGDDPNYSAGFLASARWIVANHTANLAPYFDLGWGFQMADTATRDLPSELNSTPWAGTGIMFPVGKYEGMVGLRFVHISNAGTVKPNRGQDELFLTAELRI